MFPFFPARRPLHGCPPIRRPRRLLLDVLAESFDPEDVVVSAYEDRDGRWPLALYFREPTR